MCLRISAFMPARCVTSVWACEIIAHEHTVVTSQKMNVSSGLGASTSPIMDPRQVSSQK